MEKMTQRLVRDIERLSRLSGRAFSDIVADAASRGMATRLRRGDQILWSSYVAIRSYVDRELGKAQRKRARKSKKKAASRPAATAAA